MVLELGRLIGEDGPSSASKELDVTGTALNEQIAQVAIELDVTALIGGDCNALYVLIDSGLDDVGATTAVTEMNDLGTGGLEHSTEYVDGHVMTIKQSGGGDKPHFVVQSHFFSERIVGDSPIQGTSPTVQPIWMLLLVPLV